MNSCRRHLRLILVVMLWLVPLADLALAGQVQEASIIGQMSDESGAILPGVTVTATSPALQVPQVTAVSNEQGEYRLTRLPIGIYTVEYTLAGFQTVRQTDIRLTASFTAKVDVAMKLGGLAETLTVSGAAPVVDVTSTAALTQLTKETLEVIPTGRNSFFSMIAQAPGVRSHIIDVGGNALNDSPQFRSFGSTAEPWQQIEGVATASPKVISQFGSYVNYIAIEEATVQAIGGSAEAVTRGAQINVILKSGGNDFHGGGFLGQSSARLQSNNLDDTLRAQGITSGNPIETRWDRSGDLGGRVVRNKLWFYYAGHARKTADRVVNAFKPDGSPALASHKHVFSTEKATYQASPSNKLIAFHHYFHRNSEHLASEFVPWDSRRQDKFHVHTSKLEWQAAKGNTFVSVQGGAWIGDVKYSGFSDQVATIDQLTSLVTGLQIYGGPAVGALGALTTEGRRQGKATVGWYKPGASWGNHDVKTGLDYSASYADQGLMQDRGAAQNYQLIFRSGVPFQMAAWNNPSDPVTPLHYLGLYVQDSWTLARRLTLNLGLRYAHDASFLPEQCSVTVAPPLDVVYPGQCYPRVEFKTWNPLTPRLHAAYDLTGDGKTIVKGGWGRFAHKRYVDEMQIANGNLPRTTNYRWHDDNGNKRFDSGEVNFDRNGPDFLTSTTFFGGGGAPSEGVPNPNEREPMADEFSLGAERELIQNLGVRVTGVYSRKVNSYRVQNNLRPYDVYNIPITNTDPGPDGQRGTADDPGTSITYYDYPAAYAGRAFQQPMFINDSRADVNFKSVEAAANKRLANRWQFMASYSATKSHIPLVPNTVSYTGEFGDGHNTFDPNSEIFATQDTWEWLGRLSGAYTLPADVLLSASFEHRSGIPQARTVSFTGGRQIPSITLRTEPIGSIRLPNVNLLDLSAQKAFRLGGGHRVALRLNVYNALNSNSVISRTVLSGRNFLKPAAIVPPRLAEVALTYSF